MTDQICPNDGKLPANAAANGNTSEESLADLVEGFASPNTPPCPSSKMIANHSREAGLFASENAQPHELTPPFDTFIFDLDGTLLHTLPDLVVITNMALRESGYPERSEAEILSYVGNGVKALMYQAVPENTDPEAAEAAVEHWKALFPLYDNNLTKPYPHIEEMLARLRARGCKLAVLSNKFDAGVHQVIGKYLPDYFDAEHGECESIPRKPDPTGLLHTISELGSSPQRTVYIGDSPGDIRTARNAGTYAVGVSWGYHHVDDFVAEGAEPDLMISSPLDLIALS